VFSALSCIINHSVGQMDGTILNRGLLGLSRMLSHITPKIRNVFLHYAIIVYYIDEVREGK